MSLHAILYNQVRLGNLTKTSPQFAQQDSAVIVGLPQLIHGMPKSERPCTLTLTCSKVYLSNECIFFRKQKKGLDEWSLVSDRLENLRHIWYRIEYRDGRFELSTIDFREGTLMQHLKDRSLWISIGNVSLGYEAQESCRMIKEELMQRTWSPAVVRLRLLQGREDLLFDSY